MTRLEELFLKARKNAPELNELQVVPPEAREALYPHRWFVFWTCVVVACARLSEPPTWIFSPPEAAAFNAGWANWQIGNSLSIIVLATFLLIGGALGDAFGRRRVMLVGASLALASNLLVFLSPTMEWHAFTRFISGIGGSLALPLVIVHIVFAFPLLPRILALGIYTTITTLTVSLVPQLQALVYANFDWRAVFILPIVLGGLGVWMVSRLPLETHVQANRRIDILAHVSFALVALGIMYGATQSRAAGAWLAQILGASFVIAAAGVVGMIVSYLRRPRVQVTKPHIFRYELVVLIIVGALMSSGVAVYLGQPRAFFQIIVGMSPIVAVLAYAPLGIGMLLTLVFITRIAQRITPRVQISAGFVLMAVASAGTALAILPELRGVIWSAVFLLMAIFGVGFALTNTAWIFAFTLAARQGLNGVNAAINQATYQIGWVVGTAIASAILVTNGRAEIERLLLRRGIEEQQAARLVENLDLFFQPGPPFLADLVQVLGESPLRVYTDAYAAGFGTVMWTLTVLLCVAALITWFGLRRTEQRLIEAQRGTYVHEEVISNQVKPVK